MRHLFILAVALSLAGCAICARHPTACAIGSVVIVGSVAATIAANEHGRSHAPGMAHISPPQCVVNPALCQ
jgi:hypothetical protein